MPRAANGYVKQRRSSLHHGRGSAGIAHRISPFVAGPPIKRAVGAAAIQDPATEDGLAQDNPLAEDVASTSHRQEPSALPSPGMCNVSSCQNIEVIDGVDELAGIGLVDIVGPESVGGRLAHYLSNWKQITSDPTVLEIVQGMKIDWVEGSND